MKFKLHPIKQFTLFLSVMAALAIAFNPTGQVLLHLAATLGFGLILYWFYSYFSSKHKLIWNTIVTSLIIFLVLDYGLEVKDVIAPLIATFVAITVKFFWGWKGSPVINPSVAGMLIMAGIVAVLPSMDNAFISWWGADFRGWVSMSVIAVWILFGLRKWRKGHLVITFLVAHAILLVLRGGSQESIQFIFTHSTVYFMAAAMLIDPKTSPMQNRQQIVFGLLAALVYNSLLQASAPYAELFAIAAANIGYMAMRPIKKKKKS
ncbi:MAG: hypothetical protein ACI9QC_000168 [Oceanicoccus sp.]|jgi:hypothetical protein